MNRDGRGGLRPGGGGVDGDRGNSIKIPQLDCDLAPPAEEAASGTRRGAEDYTAIWMPRCICAGKDIPGDLEPTEQSLSPSSTSSSTQCMQRETPRLRADGGWVVRAAK